VDSAAKIASVVAQCFTRAAFCRFHTPHGNAKMIEPSQMTRATFTIAAVAFLCSAVAATTPPVTFESPCECRDNHGKARLAVKNDPLTPPADASAM